MKLRRLLTKADEIARGEGQKILLECGLHEIEQTGAVMQARVEATRESLLATLDMMCEGTLNQVNAPPCFMTNASIRIVSNPPERIVEPNADELPNEEFLTGMAALWEEGMIRLVRDE